jgi:hypothetical protein
MRDIPHSPVALYEVAHLFGTLIAETILASVHVRAREQAGHMGASDLIKALQNTLRGGGRPHTGNPGLKDCLVWDFSGTHSGPVTAAVAGFSSAAWPKFGPPHTATRTRRESVTRPACAWTTAQPSAILMNKDVFRPGGSATLSVPGISDGRGACVAMVPRH